MCLSCVYKRVTWMWESRRAWVTPSKAELEAFMAWLISTHGHWQRLYTGDVQLWHWSPFQRSRPKWITVIKFKLSLPTSSFRPGCLKKPKMLWNMSKVPVLYNSKQGVHDFLAWNLKLDSRHSPCCQEITNANPINATDIRGWGSCEQIGHAGKDVSSCQSRAHACVHLYPSLH